MRHPSDGTLRRLLDEPVGVTDPDREHVADCPVCQAGLAAAQDALQVGVVMPSAVNDLAFSQSMFDALTTLQDEGLVTFEYADGTFVVDDAAAALRDWASQGYDLVIAHGTQYGTALAEIAPDFPEVSFAWGTANDTFGYPNVYAYEPAADEGGYVNGVLAATLSKAGTIGVVGPIEAGDAKLYIDGFVAGAEATNPDASVNVSYIGSFSDVALATEAANTQLLAGADVMSGTSQMVVGPVGVAQAAGVPWFGTQADQRELAPEVVVSSQVYDWTPILRTIVENVQGGTLGGESFVATLGNGGLVMAYNDGYALPEDEDARAAADAAEAGIKDGSVTPLGE